MKKLMILTALTALLGACGKPTINTTVVRKDVTELVFSSGVLEAENTYLLTAETEGYLITVDFKEGTLVKSGQLLARIDNRQNDISAQTSSAVHDISAYNTRPDAPALRQLEASLNAARERLNQDRTQAERYKRLYAQEAVSKLEYENAQLALNNSEANVKSLEQQYANVLQMNRQAELQQRSQMNISADLKASNEIKAVVAGMVYEKRKQAGDYVRRGDVIAVIGNPEVIYARLNVDESAMAKVKTGQQVLIHLNTDKETTLRARIREILPAFDKQSQSFIVKAYFIDPLPFRLTGTQLEANIVIGKHKQVLLIPRSYLGYGNQVLISEKESVKVKPGIISNDWVEIRSGLKEGQTIYTDKLP